MPVTLNAHKTPTLEELADHFGYDDEALTKLIDRQGGRSRAAAALLRRANREQARFERDQERKRLDKYAQEARDRHDKVIANHRIEKAATRSKTQLPERLANVLTGLELASTAPGAAPLAGIPRSPAGSKEPPQAALPPIGWRIEAIRLQIERLEHELDPHESTAELTGAQKDAVIILRFPGVHAADVAKALPELGSRRTIERVRSRHGLRPSTGLPHDHDPDQATTQAADATDDDATSTDQAIDQAAEQDVTTDTEPAATSLDQADADQANEPTPTAE